MAEPHRPAPGPAARPIESAWCPGAVIFDCDGILLDTEVAWAEVQAAVFTRHGLSFDHHDQRRLMGWSARDLAHEVVRLSRASSRTNAAPAHQPGSDADAVLAEILEIEGRILTGRMPVIDGARELVRRCSAQVPTAVASNSTARILHTKMTVTGIGDLVRTWVSSEDVEHGKPAPDMYLEAARRLGADPLDCLAIEDSPAGATAANRAGLVTIGVSHDGVPVPSSLLVSSLTDPQLDALLTDWGW